MEQPPRPHSSIFARKLQATAFHGRFLSLVWDQLCVASTKQGSADKRLLLCLKPIKRSLIESTSSCLILYTLLLFPSPALR
jgi:hypothetical protein